MTLIHPDLSSIVFSYGFAKKIKKETWWTMRACIHKSKTQGWFGARPIFWSSLFMTKSLNVSIWHGVLKCVGFSKLVKKKKTPQGQLTFLIWIIEKVPKQNAQTIPFYSFVYENTCNRNVNKSHSFCLPKDFKKLGGAN